jgi:hypothetical protein
MSMNSNTLVIENKKISISTLTLLIGIAVAAPLLIHQQLITGSIINAELILGASILGVSDGLLIGLIPSTIALVVGILSPALAPMIPFIILSNAILVLVFSYLSKINYWLGAIAASICKFAFLYATSSVVINLLLNKQLTPAVRQTMNLIQLFTALMGSLLAFGAIKIISKLKTK